MKNYLTILLLLFYCSNSYSQQVTITNHNLAIVDLKGKEWPISIGQINKPENMNIRGLYYAQVDNFYTQSTALFNSENGQCICVNVGTYSLFIPNEACEFSQSFRLMLENKDAVIYDSKNTVIARRKVLP